MVYEVKFPAGFDVADSVLTPPVPGLDGKWYFSIYGKLNSPDAKTYCYRWAPGMPEVEPLTLEEYTRKRGTVVVGAMGQHLWSWSFRDNKALIVQMIPDWQPPVWMANNNEVRIVAIEQKIAAIETALGNLSTSLDPKDREALDRLRDMLRI